jgi:hypothetical protein
MIIINSHMYIFFIYIETTQAFQINFNFSLNKTIFFGSAEIGHDVETE